MIAPYRGTPPDCEMGGSLEKWAVRYVLLEGGKERLYYEGPLDRNLAEHLIADVGHDATVPRGLARVPVVRAKLVPWVDYILACNDLAPWP